MSTVATPRFRGWLHVWGFVATIPLTALLLLIARTSTERIGVSVYALGLASMFGVSALYHRGGWKPRVRRFFQRLDHSTIFLAIAGTYTPIALLALEGRARVAILLLVWIGAALGIGLQWLPLRSSRAVSAAIYAIVGWAAVFVLPQVTRGLGWVSFSFVLLGGLAYTAGSIVYATKRPDPKPMTFGFHEVFHTCTLVAAAAHFAAITILVARA